MSIMDRKPVFISQRCITILCMLSTYLIITSASFAQEETTSAKKIKWQNGPCISDIGYVAEARIPAGYVFADAEGTRIIMEAGQNPPSGKELGLIAPADLKWFLVFEFDDIGYVRDDEKNSLDAEAMLKSIITGTNIGNRERKKRGWSVMNILGWEQPPRYNSETHNLEWAIKAESEGVPVINHNIRLLGRGGVMSVILVTAPEELSDTLPKSKNIIDNFTFKQGQTYSEFRNGDKIAEYGLSALIVGGAAAVVVKTGMFKWLWKIIVVCVIAVAGFFKNIFNRIFSRKGEKIN
jgi:uncharacterized membrane-anchored protein